MARPTTPAKPPAPAGAAQGRDRRTVRPAVQAQLREPRGASTVAAKQTRAPQLLTVSDVAERLRISVKTVRRQVDQGELRIHRIGRQLRVSEQDLEAFIKVWRS